jgi:hypothetical protein
MEPSATSLTDPAKGASASSTGCRDTGSNAMLRRIDQPPPFSADTEMLIRHVRHGTSRLLCRIAW